MLGNGITSSAGVDVEFQPDVVGVLSRYDRGTGPVLGELAQRGPRLARRSGWSVRIQGVRPGHTLRPTRRAGPGRRSRRGAAASRGDTEPEPRRQRPGSTRRDRVDPVGVGGQGRGTRGGMADRPDESASEPDPTAEGACRSAMRSGSDEHGGHEIRVGVRQQAVPDPAPCPGRSSGIRILGQPPHRPLPVGLLRRRTMVAGEPARLLTRSGRRTSTPGDRRSRARPMLRNRRGRRSGPRPAASRPLRQVDVLAHVRRVQRVPVGEAGPTRSRWRRGTLRS